MDPVRERLVAQLLSGPPARSPGEVTGRLLAVQAQDLRAARLSVRSRSTGLSAADVDRALTDRELVVDTLQRGTLHLVRAEDHAWLHQLLAPGLQATSRRRLAQEGLTPADIERGVAAVTAAVTDRGPLLRGQLRDVLDTVGVRTAGQALVHLLMQASLRGLLVRGPVVGREQAFAAARDWLPRSSPWDRDAALARLAERYLAGHAPADDRDLARWSGLGLRDVRTGLAAIRTVQRPDGRLALPGQHLDEPLPPPRLLGPFEPLLLGWESRDDVVGPHRGLVTVNGIFKAFALVDGRAVATWRASGGRLTVEPLEALPPEVQRRLDDDAKDVLRFLG